MDERRTPEPQDAARARGTRGARSSWRLVKQSSFVRRMPIGYPAPHNERSGPSRPAAFFFPSCKGQEI